MLFLNVMEEELIGIKNAALSFILESEDLKTLEEVKLQFLGRNGKLTQTIKDITKISAEKKKEVGMLANEVKNTIEEAIKQREINLKHKTDRILRQKIDVSNPGIKPPLGHLHLVTQAIEEITEIFEKIGYARVRYPEVEWDWYAFTALNFPENHPARDDWETFFIKETLSPKKGQMILTPHTSSGQIREMEKGKLPIRMLNIAKCYRRQSDVSHMPMFHQFEGLVVGENISIVNLKGTLDYFFKILFW
jgi:phenylalanyl-tRNA synthetase alpha chain